MNAFETELIDEGFGQVIDEVDGFVSLKRTDALTVSLAARYGARALPYFIVFEGMKGTYKVEWFKNRGEGFDRFNEVSHLMRDEETVFLVKTDGELLFYSDP